MPSPEPLASRAERGLAQARVSPEGLVRRLAGRLARADGSPGSRWVGLLTIALHTRDRRLALAPPEVSRQALAEIEGRMRRVLRAGDRYAFVAREELWIMLAALPDGAVAELAAGSLQDLFEQPVALADGSSWRIDILPVIGGACAPAAAGIGAAALLAAADAARRENAGASPRPAIRRLADATVVREAPESLARALEHALEWNELEVHFQPQVDVRSGRCEAAEALIRWRRPDGSRVSPARIIEICEQRETIGQLARFTLNTTLRHLAQWRGAGLPVSVGVNLSATTLSDPTLPMVVSQALDTWDVPAAQLTLELTESALIRDERAAAESLSALRELGCRLSIDDFGTGYSPYTYLRRFSFHELKIDQAFVRNITTEAPDRKIVHSLVALAHAFGMQAVAEGVEDQATLAALGEAGCDLAQGWHFAAALPPEAFVAWCRARHCAIGREATV
ncbi:EAL domain-containing protein [Zeimonas arvi]|nr:EAL domain-containing protein [Zeimonas arvi]